MGLISLAHGRADSRRRVGKANGWNRSGFPSFARSMQARAAGFFSGRGCYLAFPCIFPIGFWIDVRLLEKNCFCLITHGILYFVLVCIDSIFSCNLISAFLSLHSHPFTNPCSIAGRAGFIALRHRCAKIQQMQRSTWAQGRRSRTILPQDLQSTAGSACALSFPPRQQVSTCIDKSGTVKIEDLNIYLYTSYILTIRCWSEKNKFWMGRSTQIIAAWDCSLCAADVEKTACLLCIVSLRVLEYKRLLSGYAFGTVEISKQSSKAFSCA